MTDLVMLPLDLIQDLRCIFSGNPFLQHRETEAVQGFMTERTSMIVPWARLAGDDLHATVRCVALPSSLPTIVVTNIVTEHRRKKISNGKNGLDEKRKNKKYIIVSSSLIVVLLLFLVFPYAYCFSNFSTVILSFLQNSDLQNCRASSMETPIPFRKSPNCILPP